jgi:hypothetical protein
MLQSRQSIIRELEDICNAGSLKNRAVVGLVRLRWSHVGVCLYEPLLARTPFAPATLDAATQLTDCHRTTCWLAVAAGSRGVACLGILRWQVCLLVKAVEASREFNVSLRKYHRFLKSGNKSVRSPTGFLS